MMSEKFCLKWNDFNANASTAFGRFRGKDFLEDVSLVGEDNHQIAAHKLVLSSCSEYFMNIFKNNKHSHPLICLEGTSNSDLTNMLDYMYNGEVKIFQENLDRFLALAQRFQLQGLMMQGDDSTEEHYEKSEEVNNPVTLPASPHFEEKKFSFEESDGSKDIALPEKINHSVGVDSLENLKDINHKVNEFLERTESGKFKCSICGKEAKQKIQIQYHIETHVEGIEIPCSICNKVFRSRNVYRSHSCFRGSRRALKNVPPS